MALGKDDTDGIYDTMIKPVLEQAHVQPIRIDRIDFIEDIDDRITTELKGCHFVVADLTYARPSVYFEAGFAQRAVPVIYTCRKDHFYPSGNDAYGNLRVHFDLQMRNIIGWSNPTDSTFRKRLARRLSKVITPLILARKAKDEREEAKREFRALSPMTQLQQLRQVVRSELSKSGFKLTKPESPWITCVGLKVDRDHIHLVAVRVAPSISKKELAEFAGWARMFWLLEIRKALNEAQVAKLRQANERLIVCSLNKIPRTRASAALPSFGLDPGLEAHVTQRPLMLELGMNVPSKGEVHLIDGIESGLAFKSEFHRRTTWVK
jgi:hypothetical protein